MPASCLSLPPASAELSSHSPPGVTAQRKGSEKLVFLDSIRGLAALLIVVSHFFRGFYPPFFGKTDTPEVGMIWLELFGESPLRVFLNGRYAVQLFFVLSGFALSISFFRSLDRGVLSSAAIRRYFRLVLPVLTAVMIAWTIQTNFGFHHRAAADRMGQSEQSWLRKGATKNLDWDDAMAQGAFNVFFKFDSAKSLNTSLWTMQSELYGSFFVLSLLALCGTHARRYLIYAALVFILWWTDRTLMTFLFGVILCDGFFYVKRKGWRFELPLWGAALLILTGFFLCGLREEWLTAHAGFSLPLKKDWTRLGAVLLLTGVLTCPLFQRMLGWRPLVALGKLSFGLYLVHWPLLVSFGCALYLGLRDASWTHGTSVAATAAIFLPTTLAAAWVLHRIVDRPSVQLARWVEGWFNGPRAEVRPVTG